MSMYLRKIPTEIEYQIPYADGSGINVLVRFEGTELVVENNSSETFRIPSIRIPEFMQAMEDVIEILKEKQKEDEKQSQKTTL